MRISPPGVTTRVLILTRELGAKRPKHGPYRLCVESPLGTAVRYIPIAKQVADALIEGGMPFDRMNVPPPGSV